MGPSNGEGSGHNSTPMWDQVLLANVLPLTGTGFLRFLAASLLDGPGSNSLFLLMLALLLVADGKSPGEPGLLFVHMSLSGKRNPLEIAGTLSSPEVKWSVGPQEKQRMAHK